MADDVTLQSTAPATPPAATVVAADLIAGVYYPRAKLTWGADGASADASAADPLPVVQTGTPALPTGASTEGTLSTLNGKVTAVNTGAVVVSSSALPSGASTSALQGGGMPAALAANGGLKVEGVAGGVAVPVSLATAPSTPVTGTFWQATQPVSGTVAVTGVATETTLDARTGALTETAPATDTASSGINGRLQRIAQRLTTLLNGGLPAALGAQGGLKIEGVASGTTVPVSGTVTATVATKTTKWAAAPLSRSTGLTTELNSLANLACSAVGTAFDNTSNLDEFAAVDVVLASLAVAAGGYLQIFVVQSLDGTTYEDPPTTTTGPGTHMLVATINLVNTTAAKRVMSPWFRIPSGKFKLVLYNGAGVALGASANTVTLYTSNDTSV